MSFQLFVAVCILGLDFLIFVLFQWTLGDKRRAVAKKLAEAREQNARAFVVRSGRGDAETQARLRRGVRGWGRCGRGGWRRGRKA